MNTISFNRIKCLFIEYFALHWKRDLMVFGGVLAALIGAMYLHLPFTNPTLIIFVISIILCSITFNFWHKKTLGMSYLLCPANTAEKVIANALLVHVYYTAILLLSCVLARYTMHLFYPDILFFRMERIEEVITSPMFWVCLLAIQSFFLFTSVYFRKNALLKTVLFLAVLFVIFMFIIGYSMIYFSTVIEESQVVGLISWSSNNGVYRTELISYTLHKYDWLYSYALCFIAPVFFWVLSYFRLKETEV